MAGLDYAALAGLADDVRLTLEDGVATVTLERPEKRNALTVPMRARLEVIFAALDVDTNVRVVILTGAGTAFCAGVDLAEGPTGAANGPPVSTQTAVTDPLDAFSKPVIAALNGPAMGGGLELALAADIRIASETARFGLPEARIGSLAGSGGITRLSRAVSASVAGQLVLTGDPIDAPTALAVGLVSEVLPADDLLPRAGALAARIASNAPLSVIAAKQSLRAAQDLPLSAGIANDRVLWAELAGTEDRAEGRLAFREGRPARFRGR